MLLAAVQLYRMHGTLLFQNLFSIISPSSSINDHGYKTFYEKSSICKISKAVLSSLMSLKNKTNRG
jgi:hypothetical protein